MRPFLIVALVLLAGIALPQAPKLPEGTLAQACIGLLSRGDVRKELKLTTAQDAFVKGEFKKFDEMVKQIPQPKNQSEASLAQARIRTSQLSLIKRVEAKLTAPQKKRVKELGIQYFGPFSMLAPDVQKDLGLTAAQVGRIRAAQGEFTAKARDLQATRQAQLKTIPQPKDRNDKAAVQAYFQKVQEMMARFQAGDAKTLGGWKKAAEDKALKVLSAAQSAKWKAMNGVKFKPGKP